jgi:hypothetical protein
MGIKEVKKTEGSIISINKDNSTIEHLCDCDSGAGGGPLIYSYNNKVIGIHKGAPIENNWNLGTFIKEPLEEFNKTTIVKSINTIDVKDNVYKKDNLSKEENISNKSNENLTGINVEDKLGFNHNSLIKSLIGDEIIYFSDKIKKIFSSGLFAKTQERFLLITNIAVYIIKDNEIKKRISVKDLKGITISKNSNQFILHGNQNEFDHLFIYEDRKILIKIFQNLFESIMGKDLLFCEKKEKDLSQFVVGKMERSKSSNLSKIESSELSSIKEYLNEKQPMKIGEGGGGFASKSAVFQK